MLSYIAPSNAVRLGWLQSRRAFFLILLLLSGWLASAQAELNRPYWFEQPLEWAGDTQPGSDETDALAAALAIAMAQSDDAVTGGLEDFIQAHPNSAWTPTLRINLGKYYRDHGQYTLAIAHWDAAWQATKAMESGVGKRDADYAIAQ